MKIPPSQHGRGMKVKVHGLFFLLLSVLMIFSLLLLRREV